MELNVLVLQVLCKIFMFQIFMMSFFYLLKLANLASDNVELIISIYFVFKTF